MNGSTLVFIQKLYIKFIGDIILGQWEYNNISRLSFTGATAKCNSWLRQCSGGKYLELYGIVSLWNN